MLQANTPLNGVGLWSIVEGYSGLLSDPSDPASAFFGIVGEDYSLEWSISTSCATSRDTLMVTFTNPNNFACGNSMVDTRDNQEYPTVLIGNQCWMAQNLNIGTMVYDDPSNGIVHSHCSDDGVIEKYCSGNDPNLCLVYGGLYEWNEMMAYISIEGAQGICPAGWHIPTDSEWSQLIIFLGGSSVAGGSLKDTTTILWTNPNTGATNSSGFTALPGGFRLASEGTFPGLGADGYFWTSSVTAYNTAWHRRLRYNYQDTIRSANGFEAGHSIRCLKDI